MRILLLGVTGYIGGAVAERLVQAGHVVVALVRDVAAAEQRTVPGVSLLAGDASDPAAVAQAVRESSYDAVVHAAAVGDWDVDRRLVETLLAALAVAPRTAEAAPALVYTSGVWVLGETAEGPADESTPTSAIPIVAGREAVEAAVLGQDFVRGVVIRPGIVHGREGGIPELLVQWARADGVGRFVARADVDPPAWPMVHVDDLADLYLHALENPAGSGILHGVAETSVPVVELATAAADAAGVLHAARPWAFDEAEQALGRPFAEALVLGQRVDATAARALGWRPRRAGAVGDLRSRSFPARVGEPPLVVGPAPHAQASQNAPVDLQEELAELALALDGVRSAESLVSVPGARAFVLAPELAEGPVEAFQAGHEFAHLHPRHDGSLHLTLPAELAARMYAAGWGEPHPVSGTPLIFGPRDRDEFEVVAAALRASYAHARGWGRRPLLEGTHVPASQS